MIDKECKAKLEHIFEVKLVNEILKKSFLKKAQPGDEIIELGKQLFFIPLVIEGSIKVSRIDNDDNEIFLYYINAFESCALSFTCCMQHTASEIIAKAETKLEYLAIPINEMEKWFLTYPSWKAFIMETIRNRFNELLKTIDQIAFHKLDERLISYLKEKALRNDSTILNLSHEQIANDLATSRVVVSRLLKQLEKDNKVALSRNQIKILSSM